MDKGGRRGGGVGETTPIIFLSLSLSFLDEGEEEQGRSRMKGRREKKGQHSARARCPSPPHPFSKCIIFFQHTNPNAHKRSGIGDVLLRASVLADLCADG